MPSPYKHLSADERDWIAVLRSQGESLRQIAATIGRDPSTLSRELRRNAARTGFRPFYFPHVAQRRAARRNQESHRRLRLKEFRVRTYVEKKLLHGWSPELIAGRWSARHSRCPISHEAIYQWIYKERTDLIPSLVRRHRVRRRGGRQKWKTLHIPHRIAISERPASVGRRTVAGHWETDTVISRESKAALLVTVERKVRYTKLRKLPAKEARHVRIALNRTLSQYPPRLRQTLTYDNGRENADHLKVNAVLGTASYFCHPYHSWEKGTVENTIGLLRRFFPKKTDLSTITPQALRKLEHWLNNRPRKCLNYRTPAEAFREECCT